VKFSRAALASLFIATLATGALASPAIAHTPSASADCETLTVHLVSYQTTNDDPTPNVVTVSVDGTEVANTRFGGSFDAKYPLGDKTIEHKWIVQIDALGTQYDRNFYGTSTACTPPPVQLTASAAVNVKAATCDTGEQLELGAIENATWGAPLYTDDRYSVTATAAANSTFSDGTTSALFEGTLAPKLSATDPACVKPPVVTVPIKPADVVTSSFVDAVDCTTTTVTRTTTTVTTGTVLNVAGDAWVPTQPVSVVTTSTTPATKVQCPDVVTTPVDPPATPGTPVNTPVVPTDTGVTDGLVTTGVDLEAGLIAAGALLAAGIALLVLRARRRVTV